MTALGQTQYLWRAACASRLRVAPLPPTAASRSHALLCRAHASRSTAPLARLACACARASRGGQPPAALVRASGFVNALRPPSAARCARR